MFGWDDFGENRRKKKCKIGEKIGGWGGGVCLVVKEGRREK